MTDTMPHPLRRVGDRPRRRATDQATGAPMLLWVLAVLYLVTGLLTFQYDPAFYLVSPVLWGVVALAAALGCAAAAVQRGKTVTATAGGLAVTVAALRSIGLAASATWRGQEGVPEAGRWAGAAVWLAMAILIYALWERVVTPWVAVWRARRRA